MKAKELYKRDKDYIIQNGEVKIVDEFTGRILEGRRWSEGIHQAVEAKEGVKIKEENQTLATITLQNYFRMYDKLAGMTGTAATEAAELMSTYELGVVPIPTNVPVQRMDQADLIYKGEVGKFDAVTDDIAARYEAGQPVLVGTVSVEKSEYLSRQLHQRGIDHEVLNAKQHTREALIVAQAGRKHAVTVATNMAGRGVDIKLGGDPEGLAHHEVIKEGHAPEVIADPATLPMPLDQMPEDFREARAKAMARYEELLVEFEAQCKAEGAEVRELGGLYVIGSERHESRRIDNQLRGRSGRQGDPGESRFYLSLDDELMRLFATGALSFVMNKALPDDEAIEAKMVTKAIERAQTTVETRNAEIRKNVLKYDEVMNEQRKVIYARRDQILEGADLKSAAMEYLAEAVNALLETHCASAADDEWDLDGLAKELKTFWPTEIDEARLEACRGTDEMYDVVMADATAFYERREAELGDKVMREVERQVMLRIIDQRWREHLEEMDYLKEGINLRAMGQKDPLTEWQREGFEMFGSMMKGIAQDFVRYVMHVQVVQQQPAATRRSRPRARPCPPRRPARPSPAPARRRPSARRRPRRRPARRRRRTAPANGVQNLQTSSSDTEQASALPAGRGERRRRRRGAGRDPARVGEHAHRPGRRQRPPGQPARQAGDRRQGRVVEDAAQRAVPVRVGQEVQDVPRRRLSGAGPDMRDFTDDLRELRRRLGEAETYLRVAESRNRLSELEAEMGRPDLWDDADAAKALTGEYANVRDDLATYDALAGAARGRRGAPRAGPRGERRVAGARDRRRRSPEVQQRPRPARPAQPVHRRARRGRLHRPDQRQGRRRRRPGLERDAPAHVRALGRAARLRVRRRRRLRGHRGRDPLGRVHAAGSLRLRPDDERAGHPPARADQPVRQPGPPPDELRRRAGVADDGRRRRVARRLATSAWRSSGRPAPAASTSTRRRRPCA